MPNGDGQDLVYYVIDGTSSFITNQMVTIKANLRIFSVDTVDDLSRRILFAPTL